MKKIWIMLLVSCCLLLGACKGTENPQDNGQTDTKNDRTDVVYVGNTEVALNGAADEVLEALGEPLDYRESKSCLYDGYDKTYTYQDVVIITSPIQGKEVITAITVLSDKVSNKLGVGIGSSVENVKAAYGTDSLEITEYCCIWEGEFGVAFYLADGVVTEIEIYVL